MAAGAEVQTVHLFLPKVSLDAMIQQLRKEGYTVIGPRLIDGIMRLAPVESDRDLPHGVKDEQDGGHYRLIEGDAQMIFQCLVGMDSPKRFLFPPVQRLFQIHCAGDRFVLDAGPPQPPKLAMLGIRPCELAAIRVQDRVFGADTTGFRCEAETYYCETRKAAMLIAVNCTDPGGTCFCGSMATGPQAAEGCDLSMTELRAGFVVQAGSVRGRKLLEQLPVRNATAAELELAEIKLLRAAEHMGRKLNTQGLAEALSKAVEHPHWTKLAERCLGCGNCTMVCPTCFCSSVIDSTDLTGQHAMRTRQWESCFTHQFSYTTAGPVRGTVRGRYRHWFRHKLSTWRQQFGMDGCVGCGRCITWCPVGIDLTREVETVRDGPAASTPARAASEVTS